MHRVGFVAPMTAAKSGEVLDGNARLEKSATVFDGVSPLVFEHDGTRPVIMVRTDIEDSNDPRAKDIIVSANRIAEADLEWDEDVLRQMQADGVDLSKLWGEDELAKLLKTPSTPKGGHTDPDDTPTTRATTIVRGDLFQLGSHRLICGDCSNADDVARVLDGDVPTFGLHDPPYGMDLDTDWSDVTGAMGSIGAKHKSKGKKYDKVIGDDKPFDPRHLFELFKSCREVFLFGADYYAELIPNRIAGSWLVWDKRKESQADAIGSEFELCWSMIKHKRRTLRHDWFGFLSSENTKDARDRVHPTQKPVSLLVDILQQWGKPEDIIVDGYGGSGSTLIAAEQLGRRSRVCEISPSYCQVIIDRWEQFTGQKAVKL